MREKLIAMLEDIRPDVEFETENELIEEGILDSLDIVAIVQAIEDNFGVQIDLDVLEPENFNSVDAMAALIEKLKA